MTIDCDTTPAHAAGDDTVRFCTHCGGPLRSDGSCPNGHTIPAVMAPVSSAPHPSSSAVARTTPVIELRPARPGSRRWRSPAAVGLVAVVLAGAFVGVSRQVGGLRHEVKMLQRREAAADAANGRRLDALSASSDGVSARVAKVEARLDAQPDPATVAKTVGGSVFTVEVGDVLGTAWVAASGGASSTLVTNFHVVADAWTAGERQVKLHQGDQTFDGTIDHVDEGDDLAAITTPVHFPSLTRSSDKPAIGDPVLVVGSPLGLGGTVTNGIVSAFRSENGRDYVQFSAPISPGNSGGPVVDRAGDVIGVAVSKLVGDNAEGLSFAIPVGHVCSGLSLC